MYVDDIIITGNDVEEKRRAARSISIRIRNKRAWDAQFFIGTNVAYSEQGIFVTKRNISLIFLGNQKIDSKALSIPIDPNHRIGVDGESSVVDKRRYQRLVGKLIYLSHTRLNIAYAISVVSSLHEPEEEHL